MAKVFFFQICLLTGYDVIVVILIFYYICPTIKYINIKY
jgi:hypothetical protein